MIHIDIETYSEINVNKVGVYRYARHPSTEILCLAWAIGSGPINIWKTAEGEKIPLQLKQYVSNPENQLTAHNAQFERVLLNGNPGRAIGFPKTDTSRWYCTAAKAAYHALPRSLDNAARALRCRRKDQGGKFVMHALSKPKKPTQKDSSTRYLACSYPEKFQELYDYCIGDVAVEREIDHALPALPPFERAVYLMDQEINERGVCIDQEMVLNISRLAEVQAQDLTRLFNDLTGLNPTQTTAFFKWLKTQGYSYPDTTASTIDMALKESQEEITPEAIKALKIRRVANKSSIAKYQAIVRVCNPVEGTTRIQGSLLYHGASTGRWTGKFFQPHNLPRGSFKSDREIGNAIQAVNTGDIDFVRSLYPSPNEVFSSLLRSVIVPPPDKSLVVSDFASIEARVLGWIAREPGYTETFIRKEDLYCNLATKIYGYTVTKDHGEERFLGKTGILALGYGMGLVKFIATCLGYGMKVPDELLERALDTYRKTYKNIVKFWYAVEGKAIEAVQDRKIVHLNGLSFAYHDQFLKIKLPSGRSLHYPKPFMKDKETPWGEMRPALHFLGENSMTRQYSVQNTYGGKLVENIVQAISRDLLCCALHRVNTHPNYDVVLHVHDEVIAVASPDKVDIDEFESLMVQLPKWAKGLPMAAECWSGKRYKK